MGTSRVSYLKVTIFGDEGVGKSQLKNRIQNNSFSEAHHSTIGASFASVNLTNNIKLDIWDTGGQERYHSISHMYSRDANAIILAFDLSDRDSFKGLAEQMKRIKQHSQNIPIFLVGTKSDKSRAVAQSEINAFRDANDLQDYFETSAKENQCVKELFDAIGIKCVAALIEKETSFHTQEQEASVNTEHPPLQIKKSSSGFLSRHIGKILVGAVVLGGIAALAVFTGGLALTLLPLAKGFIVGGAALVGVVGGVMAGRRQDKKNREAAGLNRSNEARAKREGVGGSFGQMAQRGVSVRVNPRDRVEELQRDRDITYRPMFRPLRVDEQASEPQSTVNNPSLKRSGSEDKS